MLLQRPLDAISARQLADLAEVGIDDLTKAQLVLLRWPGPNGRSPSELAAAIGATRQATNYLLGQLEARDYLARETDPVDRRGARVQLLARGELAVSRLRATELDLEALIERELGAFEFTQLRRLLARLDALAGSRAPSAAGS